MASAITQQKLTDIWRAGYCVKTVEFARKTRDSPTDAQQRVDYMAAHIHECNDCRFANELKCLEYKVAQQMGPHAELLFIRGGDITRLPTYSTVGAPILAKELQTHPVLNTPEGHKWIIEKAKRAEEEYGQADPEIDLDTW